MIVATYGRVVTGEKKEQGAGLWAIEELGLRGNMSGGKPVAVREIYVERGAIS